MGAFLSPPGLGEGHEMLLGKIKFVLDDSCSGSPDVCRSIKHVDQSNIWVIQTRVSGIGGEETTEFSFVIKRGLENLIEGDGEALWKGTDAGEKSLCFWSLGHITDECRRGRAESTYLYHIPQCGRSIDHVDIVRVEISCPPPVSHAALIPPR